MGIQLAQTANALGCSERTLRRCINDGMVRGRRTGARHVELPYSEENYLRRRWGLLGGLRGALRTEQDVRLAVLFGSVATGDDRPDSDVDLLVVHRRGGRRRLLALQRRLGNALGRTVQVVALADAEESASLLADVVTEGRVIIDRDGIWRRLDARRGAILRNALREEAQLEQRAREAVAHLGAR